jgi:hypothetical protein
MTATPIGSDFRKFTDQEKQAIKKWFASGAVTPLLREASEKVQRESDALQKRTAISHEALQRPLSNV